MQAALGLLQRHGLGALNARRLATEVGSSTMVVYTHFGGMAGLYEAVVREAFARLGRDLRESPRSNDPVADLLGQAMIYHSFAMADAHRYRLMFGVSAPGTGPLIGQQPGGAGGLATLAEVNVAFSEVVAVVGRCMEAGRLRRENEVLATGQMWSLLHGYVMLALAGVFGGDNQGLFQVLGPSAINLLVGLGDDRDAAERSTFAAIQGSGLLVAPISSGAAPAAGASGSPAVRRGRRPRSIPGT